MRFLRSALVSFLVLAAKVLAKSSSGDAVLVLLDPSLDRANYSIFFSGLEKRGYNLTFRAPKDASPAISEYDVPNYSHVILFTPDTKTYASDITPQSLVGLLSESTNLLIALSPKQTPLTSLATEFSLILPPPGTPLLSHYPKRPEPANIIPVSVPESPILTPSTPPVWFSGIPHALGNNPHLVPVLRAPEESFAADSTDDSGADAIVDASEKGGEGLWAGSQMGLVTGFQTMKNSRVVFAGGVELFSDEYARKELPSGLPSGNAQFARDVTAWAFKETLTLRIDRTEHHRVNETAAPEMYTVNDQIVYTAYISAYDRKTSSWKPYSGIADMQLEFTMLDPHVRTALPPVAGEPGKYEVQFRAPDRHGVFKFVVGWRRTGYSFLHTTTTVPVVPLRHDQYPRFLSAAWPYYAGAISTSVGFFLFAALWLSGDVKGEKKNLKGAKSE
ncbi:Dolichyl-diphosphooligosaccharide-protein glycosyltransferase 48kDa subunit [Gyrodon lividus]|nr:Dolichyl-diphosphooligosaccharide-protein glycosyltransferase 48kDa subunit [Gyrodon lividus]